ncbi:MAG: hypothetical protein KGI28_01375 [Thaumarchaeota archaeon]|nr:hypothetical protein [Nitrososphaerota archaeon]
MIGKLIIIGIIAVALLVILPSSAKIFSSNPTLDALKTKIDHATSDKYLLNDTNSTIKQVTLGGKLVDSISTGLPTASASSTPASVPTSIYQLAPKYVNQQNYTGQVFEKTGDTCSISVPGLAQSVNGQTELTHIVQLGQCSLNVGDPVQVTTLTTTPGAPQVNPSSGLQITPYSRDSGSALPSLPPYYNVVQLSTINQGNTATLNFDDASGETKSVTVTVRNSDTVLFTGTFYSSKFTTEIKDVPNTPHIIEMTIDNAVYGTLHASAYAPSNAQNSTINGILSQ